MGSEGKGREEEGTGEGKEGEGSGGEKEGRGKGLVPPRDFVCTTPLELRNILN